MPIDTSTSPSANEASHDISSKSIDDIVWYYRGTADPEYRDAEEKAISIAKEYLEPKGWHIEQAVSTTEEHTRKNPITYEYVTSVSLDFTFHSNFVENKYVTLRIVLNANDIDTQYPTIVINLCEQEKSLEEQNSEYWMRSIETKILEIPYADSL